MRQAAPARVVKDAEHRLVQWPVRFQIRHDERATRE
jgi:hypothetical protein